MPNITKFIASSEEIWFRHIKGIENTVMIEGFKQGAEAKLLVGEFKNQRCLIKERFTKKYRHPDLDAHLTKERMRAESKAISRCQAADINVPKIFHMDLNARRIYMEYFEKSVTAKEYISDVTMKFDTEAERDKRLTDLATRFGSVIGTMHANHIIHGDLTTSNVLLNSQSDDGSLDEYDLVMIDFGLAGYSQSTEQKGVDLYVLERALLSTHSAVPTLFAAILKAYEAKQPANCREIISKFEEVRARGRKRQMIG